MQEADEHKTSLAIPIFSNTDTDLSTTDAELWWPRFILYMDLTQDTDVNGYIDGTTTLSTEKETKLKKLLIWGIGQKAIHSMTRKLHNEPIQTMNTKRIIELFKNRYMSDKNLQHNRTDFFELQPHENENPEQTWERLTEIERNCNFQTITAEELIIAKFRSIIKDKELKEKLKKADQKIETFIKILQEDTYQRKHETNENKEPKIKTEPSDQIQRIQENKWKQKQPRNYQSTGKYQKPDCKYCGNRNWDN